MCLLIGFLFHKGLIPGGEKKRKENMDAGYSMLNSDLDFCRMFDQYSYKVSCLSFIYERGKRKLKSFIIEDNMNDKNGIVVKYC